MAGRTGEYQQGNRGPKITIVSPSYNQREFIEATIRSVLLQGYPNLEYIIIDGGSDDGSVEIIRKYEPWLAYWVSEPDKGQSDAVNKGWRKASGDILGWLNSDDLYLPGALLRVAEEFRSNGGLAVLAGECLYVDSEGDLIGRKAAGSFDPAFMLINSKPAQAATFYHRRVLEGAGYLREDLHYCMDREYALRIGMLYWPDSTLNIPSPLACFRVWTGAKTSSGSERAVNERIDLANDFLDAQMSARFPYNLRRKAHAKIYLNQASRERAKRAAFGELRYLWLALLHARDIPTLREFLRWIRRNVLNSGLGKSDKNSGVLRQEYESANAGKPSS